MMEVAFTSEHYNDDGFVVDNGEPDLHVDQVKQYVHIRLSEATFNNVADMVLMLTLIECKH